MYYILLPLHNSILLCCLLVGTTDPTEGADGEGSYRRPRILCAREL